MSIRQINAAAFSDFLSCPTLYFYKNIENFAEIIFRKDRYGKNGEMINNIIDSHFKGLPVSKAYIESNPALKKWWEYYLEKYQIADKQEVYSEWSFNLPFQTANEKVILSGRIDRFIVEEDKITLYNWRTSAKKGGLAEFLNQQQVEFYAYALSKIKNIDNLVIKTVNFALKEEIIVEVDADHLFKIEKKLLSFIKKTNPEIKIYIPEPVYLENDGRICKVCHFFRLCEDLL